MATADVAFLAVWEECQLVSSVLGVITPILIGLCYVVLVSLMPEPARQKFNAVMVAGAGAAYLSSGAMGGWEIAFTAVVTFCAYRGLRNYRWLALGWLLHSCWDIAHQLHAAPIIPALTHSSFGCAICDPVIAIWLFCGAPPVRSWFPRRSPTLGR